MLFKQQPLRLTWLIAALASTLMLSGCFSDSDNKGIVLLDNPKVGSGEVFHGAEWATIKDLDPRGEQCVECHGLNADMSPYRNGAMAHNIGLQKNHDHSSYADLKITGVKINEESGEVTVTLNKAIPAAAGNLSMTFAKLAPRVIHNRGHDWQNYFTSNALGRDGNEPASEWFSNGGVAPQTVPTPQVSGNTIKFNLGSGEGRSWGDHSFKVKSAYEADAKEWNYQAIKGTKFSAAGWNISNHVYCNEAFSGPTNIAGRGQPAINVQDQANQIPDNNGELSVCWWPDGTHLTSGVFVSSNNEFIVAYEPDYTHRVTLILSGSPAAASNPGFNTWFDFVPSVANGTKRASDLNPLPVTTDIDGNTLNEAISVNFNVENYVRSDGSVISLDYKVADGNTAPESTGNAAITSRLHQSLPAARDVVDVQSCNSCHDGLTMHGDSGRSQTQTCVTCHNPGNLQASSGRSVDFKQLIHRLHRGTNLPSEDTAISSLMNDDTGLLASTASDFTKVRFPQGRTPGSPEGITNCVKCHMGSETQALIQGLANDLGAGSSFNVQQELKLALTTPQGDNWLGVRSVNACQACHDSNVWLANGNSVGTNGVNVHRDPAGNRDPIADLATNLLDKYMPFYTEKYSNVGFAWLGKKLANNQSAGWVHNTGSADDSGRFSCGSAGGCHGNNAISSLASSSIGNWQSGTPAIHEAHLKLTRNYILANRFEIRLSNPHVTVAGAFSADVQLIDKRVGLPVAIGSNGSAQIEDLDATNPTSINFGGNLGWMHNSPDFNHSPGGGIPGNPLALSIAWDGSGTGKVTADLSGMDRVVEWDKIKDDFENVIGSFFIEARAGDINFKTAVADFRFDGKALAQNEGRRKVVDFTAGNGLVNATAATRYGDWDKHDGANTQSCSSCHLELSYHGGGRRTNNVQACIICHNPQRTDVNTAQRRGVLSDKDGQYEESLDFKRLIHNIHSAPNKRIDPMYVGTNNSRPSQEGDATRGHSFPGVISNCKACHIETEPNSGKWTFELDQLPEGMIGSTAITADWSKIDPTIAGTANYDPDGARHNFDNHLKMSPIASVCSSCHDAGYKTSEGRMNNNILDGGPYVGSHWWVMGGIAPGIVRPGEAPSSTKHQSGKL